MQNSGKNIKPINFYIHPSPEREPKALKLLSLYSQYCAIKNHPFSDFSKNKIVFGVGNVNSPIVFLGEGPGRQEDLQGKPFVGPAGKLLTKMIKAMGMSREHVFITNVIKCRLPQNRAPTLEEISVEKSLILDDELRILNPKIICALGSSAMHALLGPGMQISKARGIFWQYNQSKVMPTYHPAYLLRNPSAKIKVWRDLQKVIKLLQESN